MALGADPQPSDEISALGSLLQSASGVGSISVALYGTLYVLDVSPVQFEFPCQVLDLIGVSVFLSLWASVLSLRALLGKLGIPSAVLVRPGPYSCLFWAIVAFGVAYLLLAVPIARDFVSCILLYLGELFTRLGRAL